MTASVQIGVARDTNYAQNQPIQAQWNQKELVQDDSSYSTSWDEYDQGKDVF